MDKYSKTHRLKILPEYLDRIVSGQKRFEIRKDDRDFQVGDWLHLKCEEDNRGVQVKVIYKTTYAQQEGYCVLGFTLGEEK